MGGRYRALLIGNSTYLADEHNLQTLKGPVKDIAVLNRALVDSVSGLFDDVDVTLLPEATSGRAIRALGRFFGSAERDDVLLVYFSGHGKLDENGRLHLCMQDTESTDLLATGVSSTRINEFADASSARSVVIVLDCCHAGAFRGGELGDAVAGPGRYVLTSCRSTQLANDATVDNGTSFFTQHFVDGLLRAAPDSDGDGYVSFSDLYTYIDRRLREEGKQIPQRRVNGDGDLRLARRVPRPAAAVPAAPASAPPAPPPPVVAAPNRNRRLVLAGAAALVVAAAIAVPLLLNSSGGGGGSGRTSSAAVGAGANSYQANGPWRLRIDAPGDVGCIVTVTGPDGPLDLPYSGRVYSPIIFQIQKTGSFSWQKSDPGCVVTALPGSGSQTLPFKPQPASDSAAFTPPDRVKVHVLDFKSSAYCRFELRDATNGFPVDSKNATPGVTDTVVLNPYGRKSVYVSYDTCDYTISPG